jgi:hypothetical protein
MFHRNVLNARCIFLVFLMILLFPFSAFTQPIIADHNACSQFDLLPDTIFEDIGAEYNIYYVHTSHGSQIMTGIAELYNENALYDPPPFHEVGDDLGHNGDTSWVPATRSYLNSHPECNMAMFSWCGGCSDNTEEGINAYLAKMEELEADYPDVTFIYMTGHLDGTGVDGNLYARNNQIRIYCQNNDKILFDFADIESYDPDGNYYPDETDYCNWCTDWCATHTCPSCGCAHSQCFNCYQKGKSWWWMMARLSGWGYSGEYICGDVNRDGSVNVSDAVGIINYVFIGGDPPDPYESGEANCDGAVNVSDAVWVINYVFIGGNDPCDADGDGQEDC